MALALAVMIALTETVNGPTTASNPVPIKVGTAVIEDCAVTTALDTAVLIAFAVLVAAAETVDAPLPISCPVALCERVELIVV